MFFLFRYSRRSVSLACLILVTATLSGSAAEPVAVAADDTSHAATAVAAPKANPAADKFWQAVGLLRSKSNADHTAGIAALQAAADLEFTHAQLELGNLYATGNSGLAKDARKAANLYRLAAERGNAFAMVSLGICYFTGEGVAKDEAKALQWLSAAVAPDADFSPPPPPPEQVLAQIRAGGDASVAGALNVDPASSSQAAAHFVLGALYSQLKNLPEAQAHYIAAATAGPNGQSGVYGAAVAAAINYAFGQGVPRDMAKASEMLERSRTLGTRAGLSIVQNSLAMKTTDAFAAAEAEDKLKDAFSQLQSGVQLEIAHALADKKSKNYDLAEATKWYEVAAESGQVWAMLPLAFIYYRGENGHPEPEKAFYWFEKAGSGDTPKHFLATANLAICYQNGIGTPANPAKAAELFKKWRNIDIVCYLGSIGQCPPAPLEFEDVLALNITWAKVNKDPQAQFLMGLRFRNGWGVTNNPETAIDWFKKAIKSGHADAYNQLGEYAEFMPGQGFMGRDIRSPSAALDYYQKATAGGSAAGMANYARMLLLGKGIKKDVAKAESLYERCLKLDPTIIQAHVNLGAIEQDKVRAALAAHDLSAAAAARTAMLAHYEAAKKLGDSVSALNLGNLYYEGVLANQDYRKAYANYDAAAALGSGAAHYSLGLMLEQGQGVPIAYAEAAYHYRLAALEGNTDALRRLVNFYLTGQGVSLDLDQALFWLQRMVTLTGDGHVLTTYCDVMLKKQVYDNAIPLLKQLKNSTDPQVAGFAYDRLSSCYAGGLGVPVNATLAQQYSDKAVKLGFGDALTRVALQQIKEGKTAEALHTLVRAAQTSRVASYQLGVMYYNGENVTKNEADGVRYLKAAADANYTSALVFLANLTLNHSRAAPPLDQAIEYARQAELNGRPAATPLREALERRRSNAGNSADEITRARSS